MRCTKNEKFMNIFNHNLFYIYNTTYYKIIVTKKIQQNKIIIYFITKL